MEFNTKILDFLLCTVAHLHMIFILRVEIFFSEFPSSHMIEKILILFKKRKENYKLFNTDSVESKYWKVNSYLQIVEDSLKELCEIKHIFKDIHIFKQSFYDTQFNINL